MKNSLALIVGLGILLIFLTLPTFSQVYEICYPGIAFTPSSNNVEYSKSSDGYFYVNSSSQMGCTVNFPASANGMQVTRLSLSYINNKSGGGNLDVRLFKLDRWNGTATQVGSLSSGFVNPSPDIKYLNIPKSMMTARGIDNNRYAWYLHGYSSGGEDLKIYLVTIRYE